MTQANLAKYCTNIADKTWRTTGVLAATLLAANLINLAVRSFQ